MSTIPSSSSENAAGENHPEPPLPPLYILIMVWTLLVAGFGIWDFYQFYLSQLGTAKAEVRDSFNKDLVYRKWATMHGGVYVPVTERTPPNRYLLNIPERDIETPSGKQLTLMNPAYMTRQAHEIGLELYGMQGHITSLKPIRPENAADEWETGALREFEKGARDITAKAMIAGKPYIRFMQALIIEENCLLCHSSQGYKTGDIRGGISISLPWAPYRERILGSIPEKGGVFGIIWLIGFACIVYGHGKLLRYLEERNIAMEQKLVLVKQLQQQQQLESLGMLAGGIAHDFNNILSAVIGYCGLLRIRPDRVAEHVAEIEKAAERAAELCRQMLAYAGKSLSIITQVDMSPLVNDVVKLMKVAIPERVEVKAELPANLPPLTGDDGQLRQIVTSLLRNAAEAIGDNRGEIRIQLSEMAISDPRPIGGEFS